MQLACNLQELEPGAERVGMDRLFLAEVVKHPILPHLEDVTPQITTMRRVLRHDEYVLCTRKRNRSCAGLVYRMDSNSFDSRGVCL